MKALNRKVLRDLSQLKGQAITIAILVICGVAIFVSSWSAFRSLRRARDDYYLSHGFADLFDQVKAAPILVVRKLEALPGVQQVDPRIVLEGLIDLGTRTEDPPAVAHLISVPPHPEQALNRLHLRQGRLPRPRELAGATEVVVHEGFAQAHHLKLGDQFAVTAQGERLELEVVGIAISPDTVYALSPAAPLPNDRGFGIFWLPTPAMERLAHLKDAFNQVSLLLSPSHATQAEKLQYTQYFFDELLRPYGSRGSTSREQQLSHRFVADEITQQRASAILMPTLFLSIAAFLVHILFSRLIAMHRPQIAALKALGYTRAELTRHYGKLALVMMLLGAIPGIFLGAELGRLTARSYEGFFRFPKLDFSLNVPSVCLGLLAGMLPGLLGAWTSIRAAAKLPPAEAMRPPAPRSFASQRFNPFHLETRLSIRSRIVWRNLFARPLRLIFLILGIAASLAVVVSSAAWNDILGFMLETQFQRVQRESLSAVLTTPVRLEGIREFRSLPGVLDAEGYRQVPIRLRFMHRRKELLLTGWPESSRMRKRLDTRLQSITLPQSGLLLSRFFQSHWGLSVGDRVEVEPLEGSPRKRELTVAGFSDDLLGLSASMRIEELWRFLEETPSFNFITLITDPRRETELFTRLKNSPNVATLQSKDALYQGFRKTMGDLIRITTLILTLFSLAITFGILYNSIRVTFSERSWEIASLRVLGFSHTETFSLLLFEVGTQVLLSLGPGCFLGHWLTHWVLTSVNTEAFGFPVILTPATYAQAVLAVLTAFIGSAWVVWRKSKRAQLTEALKERD